MNPFRACLLYSVYQMPLGRLFRILYRCGGILVFLAFLGIPCTGIRVVFVVAGVP